jgi:hypothetical protein
MAGVRPDWAECVSRRDVLFTAAVGGVTIVGSGVFATPTLATSKLSQRAAAYRPTPKGYQQCANCLNFEAPASCKMVDGIISPSGWCTVYITKK